jgi:hypothetical protein
VKGPAPFRFAFPIKAKNYPMKKIAGLILLKTSMVFPRKSKKTMTGKHLLTLPFHLP